MVAGRERETASAFQLQEVSFSYPTRRGSVDALRGLNLEIGRGEFVVMVGANGSGKSTLAGLLNAMRLPTAGTVRSFGLLTEDPGNIWEVRRRVGLIMENPDNQILGPTVADDIAFGPENLALSQAEIAERVDEAMATMGIADLAGLEPHLLSEGQKQKVAIAGVLAMGAEAILSDESTSLLDPETRAAVLARFGHLRDEQGITIVHITHLLEEALLADRVLVIDEGRLLLDARPREFFGDPELFRRLQLEPPPLFALAAALRESGLAIPEIASAGDLVEAICP
jgi:energy-coupling factor transport system ATP-binding protein